jgi:excisionase family DNA binding protein
MKTPPAIAKELGVKPHKVLSWIAAGKLRASNVGDGTQRPRWRISADDLAAFLAARSSRPKPATTRKKAKREPGFVEYV